MARFTSSSPWLLAVPLAALGQGASGSSAAPPGAAYAWVQLAADGPVVRAITAASACPAVTHHGAGGASPLPAMAVRAAAAPPDFPNTVCELSVAGLSGTVSVSGLATPLSLPTATPKTVVVFGDSGCRGGKKQDCARAWPFASLAAAAAKAKPDLVLHLGDFDYRGTGCPAYDGCPTPSTTPTPPPAPCRPAPSWMTWKSDFFGPAAPLLAAAPWVMVRGNHELCGRASEGFFRYLDGRSPLPACPSSPTQDFSAPYAVSLGTALRLLVLDTANACDQTANADEAAAFASQLQTLAAAAAEKPTAAATWLLGHRPIWNVKKLSSKGNVKEEIDATLQAAVTAAGGLPAPLDLLLAGHSHTFQSLTFAASAKRPPQLVVGTGGVELSKESSVGAAFETRLTDGTKVRGAHLSQWGYFLMTLSGGGFTAKLVGTNGQTLVTCDSANAATSVCQVSK